MDAEIKFIELYKIRLHETFDSDRLKKLESQILRDGYLKDPLLTIETDEEEFLVIDGVHRYHALSHLGCKYIPVQRVCINKTALLSWAHDIEEGPWLEELIVDCALKGHSKLIKNVNWVLSTLNSKNERFWFNTPQNSQDVIDNLFYWHRIVAKYPKNTIIKRVPSDISELPAVGTIRIIYPTWEISDIKNVVAIKALLPPGTTRFLVEKKLDNLHIPLSQLMKLSSKKMGESFNLPMPFEAIE